MPRRVLHLLQKRSWETGKSEEELPEGELAEEEEVPPPFEETPFEPAERRGAAVCGRLPYASSEGTAEEVPGVMKNLEDEFQDVDADEEGHAGDEVLGPEEDHAEDVDANEDAVGSPVEIAEGYGEAEADYAEEDVLSSEGGVLAEEEGLPEEEEVVLSDEQVQLPEGELAEEEEVLSQEGEILSDSEDVGLPAEILSWSTLENKITMTVAVDLQLTEQENKEVQDGVNRYAFPLFVIFFAVQTKPCVRSAISSKGDGVPQMHLRNCT